MDQGVPVMNRIIVVIMYHWIGYRWQLAGDGNRWEGGSCLALNLVNLICRIAERTGQVPGSTAQYAYLAAGLVWMALLASQALKAVIAR
jgi:hypothetical protein